MQTAERQSAEAETAQADNNEDDSVDVGDTTPTLSNVIRILYNYGKKAASKLFSLKFFDVANTPDFMKELGLTGSKFTIRYGVIARHSTKDAQHALSPEIWDKLPEALQNPFAITKYFADADKKKQKGYRLYTSLQLKDGSYIVVGAEVRNAGRDLVINSIDTVFGKRDNSGLGEKEEEIYRSKEITPEQSSLLKRPNSAQYPTEQELSADKVTQSSGNTNISGEKVEENAAQKNEGQFGLVSDARMEELKKRLKAKLTTQLNAGFDPEVLSIGMEMAAGYIDRGIKSFVDFSKKMIEDFGDIIRPYLKAFYNGAREMPGMENLSKEMDSHEAVSAFDVNNFDKQTEVKEEKPRGA